MIIVGAGIAGLLAAHAFPDAHVLEAGQESQVSHKALLRFRTPAVGEAVGIEFQKVTVRKGIYIDGVFAQPDIQLANLYARKVAGRLIDRSIWNTETVERYVAPEDFVERLVARCRPRITFNSPIKEFKGFTVPVISTVPLPALAEGLGYAPATGLNFHSAPICVVRHRLSGANVHQTIYYPSPHTRLYRASITGSLLIAEFIDASHALSGVLTDDYDMLCESFGIKRSDLKVLETVPQRFGKIAPIDEGERRKFIAYATREHGIYSLGRFATWRNILLDDVLHDIAVIRRLLASDDYGHRLKG